MRNHHRAAEMPLFFYVRNPRSTNQKNSVFKNAEKLANDFEKRLTGELYMKPIRKI
jgi:hypothetical protein